MKLAKKFKFAHKDVRNLPYTATELRPGKYEVTWDKPQWEGDGRRTEYDTHVIVENITRGVWIVLEVFVDAEAVQEVLDAPLEVGDELAMNMWPFAPRLPDTFRIRHAGTGCEYDIRRLEDGKFRASNSEREFTALAYTEDEIQGFLSNDIWERIESAPVATAFEEPEFLPPDDIPALEEAGETFVQEETSLAQLRAWTKELGVVIEVCEDFYTVKKDGYSFIANNACDLVSIIVAFRTLNRAVDKG